MQGSEDGYILNADIIEKANVFYLPVDNRKHS